MCAFHVRPWCAPNIEESRGGRPRVTPDAAGMGSGHGGDGAAEEQPGELHHASMHGGPRPSRVHNDACEFVAHAEILIFCVEETCL